MNSEVLNQVKDGYAVWLEPVHLHFHSGGKVEIKVLWGKEMRRQQGGSPARWEVQVRGPARENIAAELKSSQEFPALINFPAAEEGLYLVTVENDAGKIGETIYRQWASLLVPVGHHIHGPGVARGHGLELVPEEFREFKPGDAITFRLLYNGQPLAGTEVGATYHLYEGSSGYPHVAKSDEQGLVKFVLDSKGHWLFTSTYIDSSGGEAVPGHYTVTFVVPGVR